MLASRRARLVKLEAQRDAVAEAASHVIWLDLEGVPEEHCYLDGGHGWIFLPRKAVSAEAWYAATARMRGELTHGGQGDASQA